MPLYKGNLDDQKYKPSYSCDKCGRITSQKGKCKACKKRKKKEAKK